MLTQVDKSDTHIVQKVSLPDGTLLRYQTVPVADGKLVHNSKVIETFGTLTAARIEAGLNGNIPLRNPRKRKRS